MKTVDMASPIFRCQFDGGPKHSLIEKFLSEKEARDTAAAYVGNDQYEECSGSYYYIFDLYTSKDKTRRVIVFNKMEMWMGETPVQYVQ